MNPSALVLEYLASRIRQFLLALALVALYAAAGSYYLPYLLESHWLPRISRQTQLSIHAEGIAFDPLRLTLELQGVRVRAAPDQAPLMADGINIRLEALASLRHWRPVLSVWLVSPALRVTRDAMGRFDLTGRPADSADGLTPSLPVLLRQLVIQDGRLEFSDALRGTPKMVGFTAIDLRVTGLDAGGASTVPVSMAFLGPAGERLAAEGRLGVKPLRFDGTLAAERLDLGFWGGVLATGGEWTARSGWLTSRLSLQFPAATPLGMALQADRLRVEDLDLVHGQGPARRWRAGAVELEHIRLEPGTPGLSLGAARLSAVAIPWGGADSLLAGGVTFAPVSGDLKVASFLAKGLHGGPWLAESLTLGPLSFEARRQRLQLALALASAGQAPHGRWSGVTLAGLELGVEDDWQPRDLSLETLTLESLDGRYGKATAVATGPVFWAAESGKLRLTQLTAAGVETPWGAGSGLTLGDLEYGLPERSLAMGWLSAARASGHWGELTGAALAGLAFDPKERRLGLVGLSAARVDSVWGHFAAPSLGRVDCRLEERRFSAAALSVSAADGPWGQWSALSGEAIGYDGRNQSLALGKGAVTGLRTPWVGADRMEAEALTLDLVRRRFQVGAATLSNALALGYVDNEAPAAAKPDPAAPAAAPTGNYSRRASLGTLRVEAARGDLAEQVLIARRIGSEHAVMDIVRSSQGELKVRGLPPLAGHPNTGPGQDFPWRVAIEEFQLQDYSINFRDETTEPPVRLRFNGLKLDTFGVSTAHGDTMDFHVQSQVGGSGRLEMEGRLQFAPFRTSFRFGLDKLWMRSIEPYWKPLTNIDLQRGKLSLWGDVIVRQESELRVDYAGGAEVLEFDSVDRIRRQPLLKWNMLKFDGLAISTHPPRFVTRILTAEQPYAKILRDEHNQLNLLAALEPPSQEAIPPALEALQVEATPARELPAASVGLLRIKDGIVDFSDRTMTPGFETEIRDLEGTVSGLSSREDAHARIVLNGRINRNSPVKVFGELDPMEYRDDTDVTLQFKGLNLATFSAYSGKFGGYRIEKGKLDMDLRYTLKNDQMEVENRAVLDQLTLGEKVDASGSWLVDFAILLLKNGEGKIDIDLPVYGSLADPQFSLWKLYRDAFASLLAKIYYTPVNLVNGLVGSQTQQHVLVFAAGQGNLGARHEDELDGIAAAMLAHRSATIDIQGVADPEQDRLAMASRALLDQLKADRRIELRAQGVRLHGAPVPDLSDEDYRRLFTAYYRKRHPAAPEIQAMDQAGQPLLQGQWFELARGKALNELPIGETELRSLAQDRAESIRGYLIEDMGIADQRIFLRDMRLVASAKNSIATRLTVESF